MRCASRPPDDLNTVGRRNENAGCPQSEIQTQASMRSYGCFKFHSALRSNTPFELNKGIKDRPCHKSARPTRVSM